MHANSRMRWQRGSRPLISMSTQSNLGRKGKFIFIIKYRPSPQHNHFNRPDLTQNIPTQFLSLIIHNQHLSSFRLNCFQTFPNTTVAYMPTPEHQLPHKTMIKLCRKGNLQVPKTNFGSTAATFLPSPSEKEHPIVPSRHRAKEAEGVTEFQLKDSHQGSFSRTWAQVESSQKKRLGLLGFGQLCSSIRQPQQVKQLQLSDQKRYSIDQVAPLKKQQSIVSPYPLGQTFNEMKTQNSGLSNPIQYWFASSSTCIYSDKYQRPALREVYSSKRQTR